MPNDNRTATGAPPWNVEDDIEAQRQAARDGFAAAHGATRPVIDANSTAEQIKAALKADEAIKEAALTALSNAHRKFVDARAGLRREIRNARVGRLSAAVVDLYENDITG